MFHFELKIGKIKSISFHKLNQHLILVGLYSGLL